MSKYFISEDVECTECDNRSKFPPQDWEAQCEKCQGSGRMLVQVELTCEIIKEILNDSTELRSHQKKCINCERYFYPDVIDRPTCYNCWSTDTDNAFG